MAQAGKIRKRYYLVALMATALAETAHAPLMDGAMASPDNVPGIRKGLVATDQKVTPSPAVAPVDDLALPPALAQPQPWVQKNLFTLLPVPPSSVPPTHPSLDAAPADPISLLHTDHSDGSGVQTGTSLGGGNPTVGGSSPGEGGSTVADNPVTDPVLGNPENGPVQTDPGAGTITPITSVPEPGGFLILLSGATLLGRRRLRM